jgi:hypothetical protein
MSDLGPECAPKRTFAGHSEFMDSRPDLSSFWGARSPRPCARSTRRHPPLTRIAYRRHETAGAVHELASAQGGGAGPTDLPDVGRISARFFANWPLQSASCPRIRMGAKAN